MNPSRAVIAGAAVAGLLTGSMAVRAYAASTSSHPGVTLGTLADADHSGTVSSTEAAAFRRRAFLGLTAARLPHVQSAAQLAQLIEEDPTEVSADLAAYALMQAAADRDGMKGFPPLPSVLAEPSNKKMQQTSHG